MRGCDAKERRRCSNPNKRLKAAQAAPSGRTSERRQPRHAIVRPAAPRLVSGRAGAVRVTVSLRNCIVAAFSFSPHSACVPPGSFHARPRSPSTAWRCAGASSNQVTHEVGVRRDSRTSSTSSTSSSSQPTPPFTGSRTATTACQDGTNLSYVGSPRLDSWYIH